MDAKSLYNHKFSFWSDSLSIKTWRILMPSNKAWRIIIPHVLIWLVFYIICTAHYSHFKIKIHISVLQVFCLIGYVPSVILFTYITSFTFKKIVNTKEFWSFIYSVVSHILNYFLSAFVACYSKAILKNDALSLLSAELR